ncbi:hypothetical protein VNI00_014249 [Paramarasmius palmivorus]|uniref:Uncharacterized protein n=1 Tax=Paramarasmius palmivorus TaxID=297713 RepID=A0AAW0BW84_9AGAR
MKYLESDDDDPTKRLEDILRIRADDLPESPYPDLDLLYRQILSTCPHWDDVRKVLRLLVTPSTVTPLVESEKWERRISRTPEQHDEKTSILRSTKHIAALLGFNTGKLESLLFKLHAVIEVPDDNRNTVWIHHASFTEFLLDPSRSGVYLAKELSESQYLDLVAQAFFRAIVIKSQERYQNISTPIPRSTWYFMDTRLRLDRVFDLVLAVESPSDSLLAALDRFDPFFFASLLLSSSGYTPSLVEFKRAVVWAESLDSPPMMFLDKMKTFLCSFCVASPSASASDFIHIITSVENLLYSTEPRSHKWCKFFGYGEDHPWTSYNKAPSGELYYVCVPYPGDSPGKYCVLPADQKLPPSWSVFTIRREKAEAIDRLLVSLRDCITERLVNDIENDTDDSVCHLDLAKKQDFYTLKMLVAERRQVLGLETSTCTPSLIPVCRVECLGEIDNLYRLAGEVLVDEDTNVVDEVATLVGAETTEENKAGIHVKRILVTEAKKGMDSDPLDAPNDKNTVAMYSICCLA